MSDGVTPFTEVDALPTSGPDAVTLLEGSSFCISDRTGDIRAGRTEGLFVRDTRILSRWQVLVNGAAPAPLSAQHLEPFAAVFVSRLPPAPGEADSTLLLVRRRLVSDGLVEDVSLVNNADRDVEVELDLCIEADLADLFEVKEGRITRRPATREIDADSTLRVVSGSHGMRVDPSLSGERTEHGLRWRATVPGRGDWTLALEVGAIVDGLVLPVEDPLGLDPGPAQRLSQWRASTPVVRTRDADLVTVLRRSVEDLGALRIFEPGRPDRAVVAAGAPWFMALFGRDSLLSAWMALPVQAALAIGTLQTLADYQGVRVDVESEEEPGRIPHEVRFGSAAPLAFGARNAYYGTADATSLFVALFGELRRWGHDGPDVRELVPAVDRALDWVERYGDPDGDRFVEYHRKTERGLANQGWKDSWDGVNFADGTLAEGPIALAEVQAYTYAAYVARAELARDLRDADGELRWQARAAELKRRFNDAYWLPARGWFAVALDGAKRPVDALTSNAGHCLWTGIADADKAAVLADHLLDERMFTGWGIRTLASSMGAYNPVSYHNGSVWPHDTAICAAGLMRYGFVEHARRVAEGLLAAAAHFGHRLPELFCGFPRADFPAPVSYPTSCSPQAWAAAAPLLLLRSLLRFDPDLPAGRLWCDPVIERRRLPLTVHDVALGPRPVSLTVGWDGPRLGGDGAAGLTVLPVARPVDGPDPPGRPGPEPQSAQQFPRGGAS